MSLLLIGQIIGILAYAITAYSFTHKDDDKFFLAMGISCVAWIVHFILLGGWTGAISNGISAARWLCALRIRQKIWRHVALVFFLMAYLITGLFTVTQWYHVLPLFGSAINTVGVFLLTGVPMRMMVMFSSLCWFIYASFIGSVGGMLSEVTMSVLNIVTMVRRRKLIAPPAMQH